jgi:DHA1 family multidrug resistance protein-like MFS transporter
MLDIIRDSTAGQLIRFASGRRVLLYPEEKPSWQLNPAGTSPGRENARLSSLEAPSRADINLSEASPSPQTENLVDWYDENDAENPQNWSLPKKLCVASLIK